MIIMITITSRVATMINTMKMTITSRVVMMINTMKMIKIPTLKTK